MDPSQTSPHDCAVSIAGSCRTLQVAAARQHGLRLATCNTKDFPPERFSFMDVPHTL